MKLARFLVQRDHERTLGSRFRMGGDRATPGIKIVKIRDSVRIADGPSRFLCVKVAR